jgi:hypothetical protein
MAQQMIRGGAPVDIPTSGEIGDEVDRRLAVYRRQVREDESTREREYARGIKFIRIATRPGTNTADCGGPEAGYCWSLMAITAIFSAASDLCVFLGQVREYTAAAGSPAASNFPLLAPVGSGAEAASNQLARASFSFRECVLFPGESATAVAQSGSANITRLYVAAVQFPAERIGLMLA